MQSWTSIAYFLNSAGSFVTNCRFSPIIANKFITKRCYMSGLNHIFIQMALPCLLHCPVFLRAPAWELFPVGNQCDNTWSLKPLSSFSMWGTPSINLGIMKGMSTWIFAILTGYYHIGSQQEKIPTQVQVGRPGSERGVRGVEPNRMKMWSNLARGVLDKSTLSSKTMANNGHGSLWCTLIQNTLIYLKFVLQYVSMKMDTNYIGGDDRPQ